MPSAPATKAQAGERGTAEPAASKKEEERRRPAAAALAAAVRESSVVVGAIAATFLPHRGPSLVQAFYAPRSRAESTPVKNEPGHRRQSFCAGADLACIAARCRRSLEDSRQPALLTPTRGPGPVDPDNLELAGRRRPSWVCCPTTRAEGHPRSKRVIGLPGDRAAPAATPRAG